MSYCFIIILLFLNLTNIFLIKYFFINNIVVIVESSNYLNFMNIVEFSLSFSLNVLSFSFAFLTILIGFTTNIYILNYFKGESNELNFYFFINFFIISMLFFIFANNFYTIFLGWELIGLSSFFLINFWTNKRSTLKSSYKAFAFNLFSDIFLLISFVCFYQNSGTSDCDLLYYIIFWEGLYDIKLFNFGIIFLCLCACIKSVQLFGHLWLPDSMEAPVPASALIHSATLVSAGIYLMCKFNYIYSLLNYNNYLITLGSITAAYGGLVSASQTDMKKLLAYSTMSHCGFMWILACLGDFSITVLYLFLHGIFKASTFYCAGSFIRIYSTQDTRWMGISYTLSPLDTIMLLFCSLNLAGLPFSIGTVYKFNFFKFFLTNQFNLLSIGFIIIGMLSSLIYFYRIFYCCSFDFFKNVKHIPFKQLILTKKKINNILSIGIKNNLISVLILIIYSFLTIYIFSMFENNFFMHEITALNINLEDLVSFYTFYTNYYILFYFYYLLLVIFIILVTWKTNISKLNNIYILVFLILFILGIIFYTINFR